VNFDNLRRTTERDTGSGIFTLGTAIPIARTRSFANQRPPRPAFRSRLIAALTRPSARDYKRRSP